MSNPAINAVFKKNETLLTEAGYESPDVFATLGELNQAISNARAAQDTDAPFEDDAAQYNTTEPTVGNTQSTQRATGHFDGLTVERSTWKDRGGRMQTRVQATEYRSAWANVELVLGNDANAEGLPIGAINLQTLVDPINEGDRYAKARAGIINALKHGLESSLRFRVNTNIIENFLEDSEETSASTNELLDKLMAMNANKDMFKDEQ